MVVWAVLRHIEGSQMILKLMAAALVLAGCASQGTNPRKADLILTNGKVYTVNPAQPWADAVAVRDGKIVFVGPRDGVTAFAGPSTTMVDLDGKMLLPGFQDPHTHLATGGLAYTICPVFNLPDQAAILAKIKACAEEKPDAPIIRGEGWLGSQFDQNLPPRKELLDRIDTTRPIAFFDADGHSLWANSKAFEVYGITKDTPDPPGGTILHDPDTGALWGVLQEEGAINLIRRQWPPYTIEEVTAAIEWAQNMHLSFGITSVQDPSVELTAREYDVLDAYRTLNRQGRLKLRVAAALTWDRSAGVGQLEAMRKARRRSNSKNLHVTGVKFFVDGVVETHTALMLAPYSDRPDMFGLELVPRDTLIESVRLIDAEGFQAHFHAIGDAAVRNALDAVEAARSSNPNGDSRHQITHVQLVHPDDVNRFQSLGVTASFQPYWAFEDDYITDLTRPRVGPERINWTYPIGSLMNSGARVAFSSDWSVSSANPLLGVETAIMRVDPLTGSGTPFLPEQRIGLADAIAAYTRTGAYLNFADDERGSIEVGKLADMVVLDRNLFQIPVQEISDAKVLLTFIEGQVVYGNQADFTLR